MNYHFVLCHILLVVVFIVVAFVRAVNALSAQGTS